MKRLLIFILLSFVWLNYVAAQNDDIEVTDSTSTEWGDDNSGNLNPQTPSGPVTSMTISQTSVSLEGGQSIRLVATVNANAANKAITWTSANSEIATVDAKGNVLGMKKGKTTITATAEGNSSVKQTCTVTVKSDYEGVVNGYIFPWGHDEPWDMTYQSIEYSEETPTDIAWTRLDFNDSSWPIMHGPMGDAEGSRFNWQGDYNGFHLRREFFQPTPTCKTYTFYTIHDDDLWLYLNGELIHHFEGWSENQVRQITIPSNKIQRGRNVLALRIIQGVGGACLDYALYTEQRGDVNSDNKIDTQDAILVIQYYLGANPSNFNANNADINGDGNIDTQDAILIIQNYLSNN